MAPAGVPWDPGVCPHSVPWEPFGNLDYPDTASRNGKRPQGLGQGELPSNGSVA